MSQSKLEQKSFWNKIRNTSLQFRLVSFVLLLSLTPLIILSTRDTLQTQQALLNGAEFSLNSSAVQTANGLDIFIQKTLDSLSAEAQFADFINYLTPSIYPRTGSAIQTRTLDLLDNLSKKDSLNIVSYALVDTLGNVLLDSSTDVRQNESTEPYFQTVQFSEQPIVSYVTYEDNKTTSLTFASAIKNENGGIIGILRVKYRAAVLQDVIIKSVGPSTDTSILLLDPLSIRLADIQNPELILKSITPLNPVDFSVAVNNNRLLNTSPEEQATNYIDFELALDNAVNQPFFRADITRDIAGDDTIALAFLKTQPWIVAYSRPTSSVTADVQRQIRTNIFLVFATSILITAITTIAIRNLTKPIVYLTKTANSISDGDFSARADINTTDEIGVLAGTLNKMSSQIQEFVTNLENRVADRTVELEYRTTELERITELSKKRADELQTISEIARYISAEKNLENLLPLITQNVSERFGYYHVGIFLLNENGNFAVLRAANSPGGKIMLNRQHKLEVGQVGIVGNVTSTGKPRIALDTGADAVFFKNPDLPETRSEMAVPLIARGMIIGALDVQSTVSNDFANEDISILSLLADQVAIAIDNVRLLEEAQNALAESQSIFTEYLANAWQKKSPTTVTGYRQTIAGGKVITRNMPDETGSPTTGKTLAIPIQVREQVIGMLNVQTNSDGKAWNKDEINIVTAVAERLGLALDNARLFEETSTRASRERLVSDITTKIRGTNDPNEMIKTAMDELQRALGATRVEIIPQKFTPPDK